MDELEKTPTVNRGLIAVIVAVLMFLFFACGTAASIEIGEDITFTGFNLAFKPGHAITDIVDLDFARVIAIVMLILPLIIIVGNYVDIKHKGIKENFNALGFVATFALSLFLCFALPNETKFEATIDMSLGWGSWLYLVLSVIGAFAAGGVEKMIPKK